MLPISSLVGEVIAIKFFMIFSTVALLFGVYLLAKKIGFKLSTIFLILVLFSFTPAVNRLWGDTYRNFLIFMFLPYFAYFFLDKNAKFRAISFLILAVMAFTHLSVWVLVPAIILFLALFEKNMKQAMFCLVVFGGIMFYVFGGNIPLSVSLPVFLASIPILIFFNSIVFAMAVVSLFFIDRKNPFHIFFLILFLVIFSSLFLVGPGQRTLLIIAFPMIFLSGMVIEKISKIPYRFLKISIITIFAVFFWLSLHYLMDYKQYITPAEADFFRRIDKELPTGSVILTPSRTDYWLQYLTTKKIEVAEWYSLKGDLAQTNQSIVYNELDQIKREIAIGTLKNKHNVSEIYVFWNKRLDPVNHTNAISRIAILETFEDSYFGVV